MINITLELVYAKSPLHNFKQYYSQQNINKISQITHQHNNANMQREMQLITMHMHVVPMEQNS